MTRLEKNSICIPECVQSGGEFHVCTKPTRGTQVAQSFADTKMFLYGGLKTLSRWLINKHPDVMVTIDLYLYISSWPFLFNVRKINVFIYLHFYLIE